MFREGGHVSSYGLTFRLGVAGGASENDESLTAQVDEVMHQLLPLENESLTDAAVGLDLSDSRVEVEVTVRADTLADAVRQGQTALRSAIHAAGGYTPTWHYDESAVEVEKRRARADV